jgi:hypothetical protein
MEIAHEAAYGIGGGTGLRVSVRCGLPEAVRREGRRRPGGRGVDGGGAGELAGGRANAATGGDRGDAQGHWNRTNRFFPLTGGSGGYFIPTPQDLELVEHPLRYFTKTM